MSSQKPLQKTVSQESQDDDDDEGNIDLYGDINIEMGLDENNPNEEFGITSSPARMNRSDSILDIHSTVDFEEADLQESETETAQMKQSGSGTTPTSATMTADETFVTLPEPSKWERDDDLITEKSNDSFRLHSFLLHFFSLISQLLKSIFDFSFDIVSL